MANGCIPCERVACQELGLKLKGGFNAGMLRITGPVFPTAGAQSVLGCKGQAGLR
jgi:hypothetical protein